MTKGNSSILRLIMALIIGLLVLEIMIELSAGTTLFGGKNGIFISHSRSVLSNAKITHVEMRANGRAIADTDIREQPTVHAGRVGKVAAGDEFRIVGMTRVDEDVWYQVQRFGGKTGYIHGQSVISK